MGSQSSSYDTSHPKDREITIKVTDTAFIDRWRARSSNDLRVALNKEIHASINQNIAALTLVAAKQLASGDVQVHTATPKDMETLRKDQGWIKIMGANSKMVTPTYGVIAHGIPKRSINVQDQKIIIQRMTADNATSIPGLEIVYIGWLVKEQKDHKKDASIVIEFTQPEHANQAISKGVIWDSVVHYREYYDRTCRIKPCFKCYKYGYINTQCGAKQRYGFCAEEYDTKECPSRDISTKAKYTACNGPHKAWDEKYVERVKERAKVQRALQNKPVYWPIRSTTASLYSSMAGSVSQRSANYSISSVTYRATVPTNPIIYPRVTVPANKASPLGNPKDGGLNPAKQITTPRLLTAIATVIPAASAQTQQNAQTIQTTQTTVLTIATPAAAATPAAIQLYFNYNGLFRGQLGQIPQLPTPCTVKAPNTNGKRPRTVSLTKTKASRTPLGLSDGNSRLRKRPVKSLKAKQIKVQEAATASHRSGKNIGKHFEIQEDIPMETETEIETREEEYIAGSQITPNIDYAASEGPLRTV